MPKFRGPSAIECRVLTILAQIIRVERNTMAPGPCGIEPPECALMVGNIVEESRLVEVRAGRESVDVRSFRGRMIVATQGRGIQIVGDDEQDVLLRGLGGSGN